MSGEKKSWSDFTNEELVGILKKTFNWNLSKKIYGVLKKRKVSLSDIYWGRYDRNAKE